MTYDTNFLKYLAKSGISVQQQVPLSKNCWFQIGGKADYFIEPESHQQIKQTIQSLQQHKVPYIIIGDGSNLLFDDNGFHGVVVKLGKKFSAFSINNTKVEAESGVWVPKLARHIGCSGLTGLEHIIGIPGTLGGLVVMNGGSQRKGIGTHIERVQGIAQDGSDFEVSQEECQFSYRSSALQKPGTIVTKVFLKLQRGETASIRREMVDIMASRRKKFPKEFPNCGSVFLSNPTMYEHVGPPGKAIEDIGLRGLQTGGAQISPLHGNFIINKGDAKAMDVLKLIHQMRQGVKKATGYTMDAEVRFVAANGTIKPAHEITDNIFTDQDLLVK